MSGLKVGIIGSGFIATQKHLPAWQKIVHRAQVVALCDVNGTQAQELARAFDIPKIYGDAEQMQEQEKLDIIDICSPPRTHADLAIRALQAGAHVLIEKPMAVSTEECDAILAAAQQSGRKVCVAHSDLFYPSFLKARELAQRGEIGEFRGMRIFLSTPVDYITSKPDHWAHNLPGGVIGETGPHVVYMTLAFINPIHEVHVQAQKLLPEFPWSPYEDYRLNLAGEKATSSITLTYATNRWANQVDLWGSGGHLKLDLETQSLVRHGRSSLKPLTLGFSAFSEAMQALNGPVRTGVSYVSRQFENTHDRLVRGFVESIDDGAAVPVSAEEGREAVRVMDLIVKAMTVRAG